MLFLFDMIDLTVACSFRSMRFIVVNASPCMAHAIQNPVVREALSQWWRKGNSQKKHVGKELKEQCFLNAERLLLGFSVPTALYKQFLQLFTIQP